MANRKRPCNAHIGGMSAPSATEVIAGKTIVPTLTRKSSKRPGFIARKSWENLLRRLPAIRTHVIAGTARIMATPSTKSSASIIAEQKQPDYSFVPPHEAARDQIDNPQCDCRIGQRHQLKRPVGEWKHRCPCARNPSHQRRMFGVTPFKPAPERPRFQDIRVQIAAEVGDDQKAHPNRYKSGQQKRNSPSRFNAVQPTQKRLSPTRRGNIRTGSHIRERMINWHKNSWSGRTQLRSISRCSKSDNHGGIQQDPA